MEVSYRTEASAKEKKEEHKNHTSMWNAVNPVIILLYLFERTSSYIKLEQTSEVYYFCSMIIKKLQS